MWFRRPQRLAEIAGEKHHEAECLLGPGVGVLPAVELAGGIELEDVADLEPIQALVLERLVEALNDAVRLRRVVASPGIASVRSANRGVTRSRWPP